MLLVIILEMGASIVQFFLKVWKLWSGLGLLLWEKLSGIRTHLLSNKSSKMRRKLTTNCFKYVDWMLKNSNYSHLTEKLKFCDAFCVASSIVIRVIISHFFVFGLAQILQRFFFWIRATYCCTSLMGLCSSWGSEMTGNSGENYDFFSLCESPCCVMYGNNILPVLIFSKQAQYQRIWWIFLKFSV